MAVAIEQPRSGVGAWRERWERSWLARAFTPSNNPYLVHELNLIARDRRFLFIAVVTLGFMGLAYRYMGVVSDAGGLVFLQEVIPLLAIFASFVLLFYRLQRPHIRYHAENAVFLCILPRDGAELLHCQVIAVLFQPMMLFLLLLPGSLLLLGLGIMSPIHLAMKLGLGLLILMTLAVHGVCRVPRMTAMFFGFPFAMFLFIAAGSSVLATTYAVISQLTSQSGLPWDEATIMAILVTGLVLFAMPVLLWFATINPLLTWLVQTTPWGETLRLSEDWSVLRTPFGMMVQGLTMGGGMANTNTLLLTQFAEIVDSIWSIPTLSAFNWIFLGVMQYMLMRDALIRGTDQFEYFRVRGYPERLKELRWMERERLRTRNQRTLSAQLRPIGIFIHQRMPSLGTAVTWATAWLVRPYAPRMAYRALTIEPDVLEAYYAQRRRSHAPGARRVTPPSAYGTGPASMSRTPAPPPPYIAPPPYVAQDPALQTASPPPPAQLPQAVPGLAEAMADAAPITTPPWPVAASSGPASTSAMRPPATVAQDHPEEGHLVAPRRRPAPLQMLWLTRPLGRMFLFVSHFFARLVPAALRQNPYFMRDWRSMQRVLQGEQEGQWAYSWTVLLIINLSIAAFVLFLVCTVQGLGLFVEIGMARRNSGFSSANGGSVQFAWAAEHAWVWLQYIFSTMPVVYFALPIYAWLKERKRPDWELTLLCPQMGAGWLAGKWAYFMQLGIIGIAGLFLLLMLMDPLLWMGWIVPVLVRPVDVTWSPLLVNPISGFGYLLLLLGYMAWLYQTVQFAAYLIMCFPTTQSKTRSFSVFWGLVGIGVSCWIMYEIAMSGDAIAFIEDNIAPLQELLDLLYRSLMVPLNYLLTFVGSFIVEMMPLSPWTLWVWFWGPNNSFSSSDLLISGVQSAEAVLLTLGLYWGFALLNYRLSLHLLQTRLRSLEPKTFSLLRKRLPSDSQPAAAREPVSVV